MMLVNKTRTFIVTLILIFSSFSILYSPSIKADDPFGDISGDVSGDINLVGFLELLGAGIDFENILIPHPYRYTGVWKSNDSYNIEGEMDFKLYISSTLMDYVDFLGYQDKLDVSLYHLKGNDTPTKIEEIKDAKLSIGSLDTENMIHPLNVKMDNLNISLNPDDYLLFGIEINQTKKPLSTLTERILDEERIEAILEKLVDISKESDDPEIQEFGVALEETGIKNFTQIFGGEEFGSIVNAITSSAFYYGSKSYDSNVKFSSDSGKNFTLYFGKEGDLEFESRFYGKSLLNEYVIGYFKNLMEGNITSEEKYSWPPVYLLDFEEGFPTDASDLDVGDDALNWGVSWFVYTIGEVYKELENTKFLYLKDGKKMETSQPDNEATRKKLSNSTLKWSGPSFERNQIITNASAELYIHYPKIIPIGDIEITASLFDEEADKKIASEKKIIDRATLSALFSRGPEEPTTFNFEFDDYEISYDHSLKLEVYVSKSSLFDLRPIYLLYNSEEYPSHIRYVYEETDNIAISETNVENVYAGGSTNFDIIISSNYSDNIDIEIAEKISEGSWDISWSPKKINVEEESDTAITVSIKSTATDESAYGKEYITLYFNATGKTGIDSKTETIKVDESKVEYDVELVNPNEKLEVKHGEEKTFKFIIRNKNTGFLSDAYSIDYTSENGFYANIFSTEEVSVYEGDTKNEVEIEIKVKIPRYTDIGSDKLIINISSDSSYDNNANYDEIYTLKVNIITPNIFESAYRLFEKLSERIGLDDALGEDESFKDMGPWILIAIFLIILLIILLIIISIITRKFASLICLKRIKEIKPDEKAVFEITIKNPYKKVLSYEVKTEINEDLKNRWNVELERDQMSIGPKQSDSIRLHVEPTDNVKPQDWIKVSIIAKPIDKRKKIKIDTITIVKDSDMDVSISGVIHWPKPFKKGDRVETSFKLFNKGNVSAERLAIFLYVNGKQKNKVEDVTIPVGGHADIVIPWIAEKGKNEIEIIVK